MATEQVRKVTIDLDVKTGNAGKAFAAVADQAKKTAVAVQQTKKALGTDKGSFGLAADDVASQTQRQAAAASLAAADKGRRQQADKLFADLERKRQAREGAGKAGKATADKAAAAAATAGPASVSDRFAGGVGGLAATLFAGKELAEKAAYSFNKLIELSQKFGNSARSWMDDMISGAAILPFFGPALEGLGKFIQEMTGEAQERRNIAVIAEKGKAAREQQGIRFAGAAQVRAVRQEGFALTDAVDAQRAMSAGFDSASQSRFLTPEGAEAERRRLAALGTDAAAGNRGMRARSELEKAEADAASAQAQIDDARKGAKGTDSQSALADRENRIALQLDRQRDALERVKQATTDLKQAETDRFAAFREKAQAEIDLFRKRGEALQSGKQAFGDLSQSEQQGSLMALDRLKTVGWQNMSEEDRGLLQRTGMANNLIRETKEREQNANPLFQQFAEGTGFGDVQKQLLEKGGPTANLDVAVQAMITMNEEALANMMAEKLGPFIKSIEVTVGKLAQNMVETKQSEQRTATIVANNAS